LVCLRTCYISDRGSERKNMDSQFTSVEETLKHLIEKATRKQCVRIDTQATFKDLGVDSLEVVQILVAIEDIYGIDLVDDEMRNIHNMQGFICYIENKVKAKSLARKTGSWR